MKKIEITFLLDETERKLFTTGDLKKLLRIEKDNTVYKTIEGLIKEKILIRLSKGKYLYRNAKPHDFEIANFLSSPSYISFESALNFYNILVQVPYSVTSATTLRNKVIYSNAKEYIYTHVDPRVYFGYKREGTFLIATPEKALIDLLYLASKRLKEVDIKNLDLSQIKKKEFYFIIEKISNRLLNNFAKKFIG
ncbi:MAG: hypothetical protein ISS47_09745 [Candidatus Omnitrophica bacterium]|nr:hypothetical protein [Candidatus Omnitrophota bacterium]